MGTMVVTPLRPSAPAPSRVGSRGEGTVEDRPSPRHVTSVELAVLQSCLQRWREEVELDVKELQQQISELETTIGSMYAEEQLQKYSYRLHAVLVHEGEAVSGHYWAYVRRPSTGPGATVGGRWLKFNDIAVTDTSWAELWHDGAGGGATSGTHHTSAYCLVYTDSRSEQLFRDTCPLSSADETDHQAANSASRLQRAATETGVAADNEAFETEIAEWDRDELERRLRSGGGGGGDGGDVTPSTLVTSSLRVGDGPPLTAQASREGGAGGAGRAGGSPLQTFVGTAVGSLQEQHASLAAGSTYRLVQEAAKSEKYVESGPLSTLKEACERDIARLTEMANRVPSRLPRRDACLSNFVVYLLTNHAARRHVSYTQLQQVALLRSVEAEPRSKEVRQCAYEEMERYHSMYNDEERNEYKKWHADYGKFRLVAKAFSIGVDEFYKENYVDALPYLVFACDKNSQLNRTGGASPLINFDPSFLARFRRHCLLHLNECAASQFVTDDEPSEGLSVMTRLVLPSLPALNATGATSDQAAIEEIRGKWCLFLNQPLQGYKVEKLQDCLSRLLEEPHEDEVRTAFPCDRLQLGDTGLSLVAQYRAAMDVIEKHGHLMCHEQEEED